MSVHGVCVCLCVQGGMLACMECVYVVCVCGASVCISGVSLRVSVHVWCVCVCV